MNKEDKEELLKEIDRRLKVLRDEFISKLEDDKKEFELTYPEDGASVYFIYRGDKSVTNLDFWNNSTTDKNIFEIGEYFNTKEEAEQCLRERELLFKLHQWAKEKNDGWELDWEDEKQRKVFITYYKSSSGVFRLTDESTWVSNRFSKLPYFKSIEIAQECIDLFGDEIKEVLV
jgi:hypothetical protein